ncbi:MAG TPA: hypothetical protein VJ842_17235 [Pyrinomonadaceae bacterium]|nr:hypothetical protein [Pyrinomonadaceae bacterium]
MSLGEYESSDETLTQWRARVKFLKLLHNLAPEVVKELSSTLLRSFQTANTDGTYIINQLDFIKAYSEGGQQLPQAYSIELINFYQELTDWANTHWLNERWLIETLIRVLEWWIWFPHETGQRVWTHLPVSENWFGEEEPFRFEHLEWRYHELKESEYRQVVEEHFRKELNIYLKHRASQALASGDQPVKRMRKSGDIDFIVRIEWFVLYQVRGLTTQNILERYTRTLRDSATPKQVSDSLKEMSALIGLPLRPAQRGRPKKQQ